jgi:ABC-type molybdate transport system permease subunit
MDLITKYKTLLITVILINTISYILATFLSSGLELGAALVALPILLIGVLGGLVVVFIKIKGSLLNRIIYTILAFCLTFIWIIILGFLSRWLIK